LSYVLATPGARADTNRFVLRFVLLAAVSGATIGMAKLLTTLYALHVGAGVAQVGIIAAMEPLGMALLTLPAGFLIARFGARHAYAIASIGPLLINLLIPLSSAWYWIAASQLLIGLCIPFRVVSMNSAFLERLQEIGASKAGWYRAALMVGMGLCGPFAADALGTALGYGWSFTLVAASFGGMAWFAQTLLPDASGRPSGVVEAPGGVLREIRVMLAMPAISESCLVEFVSAAVHSTYTAFVVVIALQELQLTRSDAVLLVMTDGAASVASLLLLGPLVGRITAARRYAVSLLATLVGLAMLGGATDLAAFAAGAVSLSIGTSLIHLINMEQMSRQPVAKSKISSLFNATSMAGAFGGPLVAGAVSQWTALQNVFLLWIPVVACGAWLLSRRAAKTRAPRASGGRLPRWRHALARLVPLLLLLAAWDLAARWELAPRQILPSPLRVLRTGMALWDDGTLLANLDASLLRLAAGFLLGAVAGIAFGVALGLSRNVRDFCGPLFEFVRQIPTVALIPVFILFFGVGETLKILIVFKGVFVTVAVAARDGVLDIPRPYFEVATLYRLGAWRRVLRLVLPAATPAMLTGLRAGLMRSWMLLMLTEEVAAESGLGQLMEFGRQSLRMDTVMVCVVLTGGIGYLLDALLKAFERWLLRWRPA